MRGLPAGVRSIRAMSSASPVIHGAKAGGGEQVVEAHRQLEALLRRIEGFEIQHADPRDRRRPDLLDERWQIEVAARAPGRVEDRGDQDVLAALDGIGRDAEEREQAGGDAADAVAKQLGVVADHRWRRREGLEDGDGETRLAARRVDGDVDRLAKATDARAVLAPVGEALRPQLRLLAREVGRGEALSAARRPR